MKNLKSVLTVILLACYLYSCNEGLESIEPQQENLTEIEPCSHPGIDSVMNSLYSQIDFKGIELTPDNVYIYGEYIRDVYCEVFKPDIHTISFLSREYPAAIVVVRYRIVTPEVENGPELQWYRFQLYYEVPLLEKDQKRVPAKFTQRLSEDY